MAVPSKRKIRGQIEALRRFIDRQKGETAELRIAYAMETALRWSIEDTKGWPGMVQEAKVNAGILDASRDAA